jgi:beta-mannosidase
MELDEWSAAVVDASTGSSPPTADEWTAVSVPGSLDRFAGGDCVAYRTDFRDPRSGGDTRALLRLEGIYAKARIWLNGDLLGTHDTYFAPFQHLFEPEADNELVVECRPPDDRFGGVHDTDLVPATASVPGIRWGATVEGVGPAAMTGLRVRPRLEGDQAVLAAELAIDAEADLDDTVTFSLRPEGFRGSAAMERTSVTAAAGERVTLSHEVVVDEPRLWYPRGHGPQHRYTLVARFGGRELARTTGLATVERDDEGIAVNGRRVRLRGFNRLPGGDPGDDVERAVEANANFVRAHAHVPRPAFHAAAAAAGLLVFQDLPLTGPGGYDIDRARELARRLDERYGHHPSLGLYGVHDDPRDPFASPVGGGFTGRLRIRWRARRAAYNAEADESVAAALPDDVPTFPVCGPVGIDADATHLYPGWDYGTPDDVEWLLGRNPDLGTVVTEFGAGALADEEVDDPAGFDRATHDARVDGGVADSQAYQARTLKRVAEALRRHGSHAMAAFALRDADDGAGMGVLAHDGAEKAAFEAISQSYEPVVATLDGRPSGSVGTTVVNDTGTAVEGEVAWTAGDQSGEAEVTVDPFGTADGPTVEVPGDAEAVVLTLSHDGDEVANRYPV